MQFIEKSSFHAGEYVAYDPEQGGKAVAVTRLSENTWKARLKGSTFYGTLKQLDNYLSDLIPQFKN